MDRLQKLERGWLFYKLRQLLKGVLILAVAVLIGGGTVYLLLQGTRALQNGVQAEPKASLPEKAVEQPAAPISPKPAPSPAAPVLSPLELTPNYDFEQEIKTRLAPPSAKAATPALTPPTANGAVAISRVDSLAALESAFMQQPSYAKAVEIAEAHLAQSRNEKALEWALKANEINNEDERSWAVFATASNRLGRSEQAINALKAYLAAKPSSRLMQLLERLEQP